ncbi:MAG TPA: group I intron-associated PD-(D/E)XK endonuclease [Terriglobales bacterium]|nr:group I intron-associated PD-(D/E)XK endonuclease [Terriglobales bacterium]
MPRRDPHRNGELAEAAFIHKAISLGFLVSKPFGPDARYDFILDSGTHLYRVQVRGVRADGGSGFQVSCHYSKGRCFTPADIDLLAAYVLADDSWYIVPIAAFALSTTIAFRPGGRGRFECYREAWHLLR